MYTIFSLENWEGFPDGFVVLFIFYVLFDLKRSSVVRRFWGVIFAVRE